MELSIIVAAAENNVIGRDNTLIWHLSADLKRFKSLTMGHTIVMGRKTFESIGRPLPNRRNIVISTNQNLTIPDVEIASDIFRVFELTKSDEKVFIIGGGTIYQEFWGKAVSLYLTKVYTNPKGDTFIPDINMSDWVLISREDYKSDDKNDFDYSFIDYQRRI